MQFLAPLALALGALAGPIILLYMLKLRRREMPISSTLLWQMVLRDREANTPWQRLRRNLLLLLQLLLLAALVMALARPFLPVPVVVSGQVTVLIDASASMQATDVSPNRFEVAREAARQLVNGLAEGSPMTVILVADQPSVMVSASTDPAELLRIINDLEVSSSEADWDGAMALAAGAAGNATNATTVIITDGGLPDRLFNLPGDVRYVPVGDSSDNVGISALSVRPAPDGPQLFVGLTNYSENPANTVLTIKLAGQLFQAQRLELAPGATEGLVWDLPESTGMVSANLSAPSSNASPDHLLIDDNAWVIYDPAQSGRVLFVTQDGNIFIEQVLAALPGVQAFRAPADRSLPTDPFDLYIFDSFWPDVMPEQEALFINPPESPLFTVGPEYPPTRSSVIQARPNSPINAFVQWETVNFLSVTQTEPPDWAEVQAVVDGVPLLFNGIYNGHRTAVMTFDPRNSDMPLQVAFPILFANLVDWLTPGTVIEGAAEGGLRVGDPVTILPDVGVEAIGIRTPDGRIFSGAVTEAGVIFGGADRPGLYIISDQGGVIGQFAVNLFSPAESNITPHPTLTIGQTALQAAEREEIGQRELWPWLAGIALTLLLIEWWVYHRRSTVAVAGGWRGWLKRRQVGRETS